jgi:alkylation response protein AidB-like acyl-CoA dehydrogenase
VTDLDLLAHLADPDDGDPLVVAARGLAEGLLAPAAERVDATAVPRSHLDALAAAGLLGLAAPRETGGSAATPGVARRVSEVLAGADLATWFVQVQHQSAVQTLARSGGFENVLAELASGRCVAGIAFSHLRRWPELPVTATRDGRGWRLDGVAPWYTGWGINDVVLLAGASGTGDVVFALVPARAGDRLRASAPRRLAALQAAVTVTLYLDGLRVPDSDVVRVQPVAEWAAGDRRTAVNVNPAVFGLAASALRLLAEQAARRDEAEGQALARRLAAHLGELRAEAYHLVDELDPDAGVERRLQLRAEAQHLLVEVTTGLVVAGAGGAMALSAPAQRKAREALFLLVQAQTAEARRTALERWDR